MGGRGRPAGWLPGLLPGIGSGPEPRLSWQATQPGWPRWTPCCGAARPEEPQEQREAALTLLQERQLARLAPVGRPEPPPCCRHRPAPAPDPRCDPGGSTEAAASRRTAA